MAIETIILAESGGPTPVIDWQIAGALAAAQKHRLKVLGSMNGIEGIIYANVPGNIVDLTNINPSEFMNNGPGASLRTTRKGPKEADFEEAMNTAAINLRILGVNGIGYFGGNDSAHILKSLVERTCTLLGIHGIKTVDNDLPGTHHSPGYGSMSKFNATAIKAVHNDFSSYQLRGNLYLPNGTLATNQVLRAPVFVYQVMGRKCGYGVLGTTFAKIDPRGQIDPDKPPHIILNNEFFYHEHMFLSAVSNALDKYGEVVIAVQEDLIDGLTGKSFADMYSQSKKDAHDNLQHGRSDSFSPAIYLAQIIKDKIKTDTFHGELKDLAIVPHHLQRSYAFSMADASEAYRIGYESVVALMEGETNKSVILKKDGNGRMQTALQDLDIIAGNNISVPSRFFNGVNGGTQEFVDEFVYLIDGPLGIPHYARRTLPAAAIPKEITKRPYATPHKPKP